MGELYHNWRQNGVYFARDFLSQKKFVLGLRLNAPLWHHIVWRTRQRMGGVRGCSLLVFDQQSTFVQLWRRTHLWVNVVIITSTKFFQTRQNLTRGQKFVSVDLVMHISWDTITHRNDIVVKVSMEVILSLEHVHSISNLLFGSFGESRWLIVSTSWGTSPVTPTFDYWVWRVTCSAGPRLFPIFEQLHWPKTRYWDAQETRGKE